MDEKKMMFVYRGCQIIYLFTLIYAFVVNWGRKYFMMTCIACFTPLFVPILIRLLKIKVPIEFYIMNLVFVYFASVWGSCLGGYSTAYFDKIVHCTSGVVITEVIYCLYKFWLKEYDNKICMFLFLNSGNAMVALLWEFYEFLLLVFFQYDAIRNVAGVYDTITDMLVAVIGGLCLSLYLVYYDNKKGNHFFVFIGEKNYYMNKKREDSYGEKRKKVGRKSI